LGSVCDPVASSGNFISVTLCTGLVITTTVCGCRTSGSSDKLSISAGTLEFPITLTNVLAMNNPLSYKGELLQGPKPPNRGPKSRGWVLSCVS